MSDLASSEASLRAAAEVPASRSGSIIAARVLLLLLALSVWQGAVAVGLADPAFISTPAGVAQSLWTLFKSGEVVPHLGTTLTEMIIAFALSVVFGVASAIVFDRNDWLNRIVSPFLTALNSMPRIALGPLFILWFGIGIASKVMLAFSLGYFIMLLSTLGGLKNVDRDLLLMSRLFGASEFRLFRHVRLPWALPGIFLGPQAHADLLQCRCGHRRDDRCQERAWPSGTDVQWPLRCLRRHGADSHRRADGDDADGPYGSRRTAPPGME